MKSQRAFLADEGPRHFLLPDPLGDMCDDATWKSWAFYRAPPSYDPFNWTSSQWTSYIKDYPLRSAAFSIALTAIALVLLLGFLIWRLVQWCVGCSASGCGPCCPGPGCGGRCGGGCGRACALGSEGPAFLHDRKHTVLKIVISLLLLGALAMVLYGMIQLDPALLAAFWEAVRSVLRFGDTVAANLGSVENAVGSTLPAALEGVRAVVRGAANTTAQAAAEAQGAIAFARSAVAPATQLASNASSAAAALANATGALAALAAQLGAGNATSSSARRSLRADDGSPNAPLSTLLPALAGGLPAVEALPGTAAGVRAALQALEDAGTKMAGAGPADPTPPPGDAAAALAAALGGLRLTEWGEALGNATRGLEAYGEARWGPALRSTAEAARTVAEAAAAASPAAAAALVAEARALAAAFAAGPQQALADLRLRLASLDRDVVAVGGWSVRLGNGTSVQVLSLVDELLGQLTTYLATSNGTNSQPSTAGRSQPFTPDAAFQALTSAAAALSAAAPSAAALAAAASAAAALASSGPEPGPLAGLLRASLGPALASLRGPAGALGDALTAHTADPSSAPKLRALRQALNDHADTITSALAAFTHPALQQQTNTSQGQQQQRRRGLQQDQGGKHALGREQQQQPGCSSLLGLEQQPGIEVDEGPQRRRRLQQQQAPAAAAEAAPGAAGDLAAAAAELQPAANATAAAAAAAAPASAAAYGNLTAYGNGTAEYVQQYAQGVQAAATLSSQLPPPEETAAAVANATAALQAGMDELMSQMNDACSSTAAVINSTLLHMQNDLLNPMNDFVDDWQSSTENASQILYDVWMACYALALALLLLLLVATWANWVAGHVALSLVLLVLCVAGQGLASALGFGMSVLHDACGGQIEQAMLQEAVRMTSAEQVVVAMSYYVYDIPDSVDTAFMLAFNMSTDQARAALDSVSQGLRAGLQANYTLQGELADRLSGVEAVAQAARGHLDAALDAAVYDNVHPVYGDIKTTFCCDAGNLAYWEWCAMTAAVCLFLAALLPCTYLLARMDLMRRKACCDCCDCAEAFQQAAEAVEKPPSRQRMQKVHVYQNALAEGDKGAWEAGQPGEGGDGGGGAGAGGWPDDHVRSSSSGDCEAEGSGGGEGAGAGAGPGPESAGWAGAGAGWGSLRGL
ncbi:hypothetical protein HYH03_015922 [Edaphochlamys debaryana]|uniref:Uncharacterized protein n=1 Tax=Edaphochlamys debaryana TaxID=47281 RepID=A0A835XK60_9CHLO|nr:hypothetical protein HYH03_015922 [Edaphochlamys debaryana]|eukprot:KAG2485341.1 hypothetical protein HYH03_015922 [Edaphochlamys debaryana]